MKYRTRWLIFLLSLFFVASNVFAQKSKTRARAEEYADFMEHHLIFYRAASQINSGKSMETIIFEIIDGYKAFAKNKPHSRFTAQAKLNIAELLNGLERVSEKAAAQNCDHKWRIESNKWLLDVARKNPHNQLFDFDKMIWTQEKAGALALYYLGTWNNNDYFLERLAREYPKSVLAKKVSEKLKTDKPTKRP